MKKIDTAFGKLLSPGDTVLNSSFTRQSYVLKSLICFVCLLEQISTNFVLSHTQVCAREQASICTVTLADCNAVVIQLLRRKSASQALE